MNRNGRQQLQQKSLTLLSRLSIKSQHSTVTYATAHAGKQEENQMDGIPRKSSESPSIGRHENEKKSISKKTAKIRKWFLRSHQCMDVLFSWSKRERRLRAASLRTWVKTRSGISNPAKAWRCMSCYSVAWMKPVHPFFFCPMTTGGSWKTRFYKSKYWPNPFFTSIDASITLIWLMETNRHIWQRFVTNSFFPNKIS